MPSAVLAAVATGAMLGLPLALYREHREPFLFWAVVAWAGTLAGFLAQVPRELAWQRELWAFTAALAIAVKSLAFPAAGLTYRAPALVSRRRVVIGLGVAFALTGVQTAWLPVLPPAAGALRELPITLTHAGAILIAGCAFWPGGARRDWAARSAARAVAGFADRDPLRVLLPHGRGAQLLALALLAWGAPQFGFLLPIPAPAERALFRIAALPQWLQSVALVMLVLDTARQRAEFVRGFNQTLLDAMDTGWSSSVPTAAACARTVVQRSISLPKAS